MNAPLPIALLESPKVRDAQASSSEPRRYLWESRFGLIVIEVLGDQAFVNGQPVEPMTDVPASAEG
jgi:hypothetical protein